VTGVLAVELASRGIRVDQINPGAVDTEGARAIGAMSDEGRAAHIARTPLGRVGTPADIASHEQRWLPHLSPPLPVPIPVPVRVGIPGPMFDWSWSVVRWLPGQSVLHAASLDPVTTGTMLESFLCALHQPAPVDAPRNPWRGVPLKARTAALHQHLHQLDGVVDRTAVLSLWDRALSAPSWPGPPLWLHGDLHPGNLLVSDGHLSGVIDFGDLTSGDPATDLSLLWMLPRSIRSRFEAWASGEPDGVRDGIRNWLIRAP